MGGVSGVGDVGGILMLIEAFPMLTLCYSPQLLGEENVPYASFAYFTYCTRWERANSYAYKRGLPYAYFTYYIYYTAFERGWASLCLLYLQYILYSM